jgi:hypothetical protein
MGAERRAIEAESPSIKGAHFAVNDHLGRKHGATALTDLRADRSGHIPSRLSKGSMR